MVNEDGLAGQLRTAQDTFIVMSVPQSSTKWSCAESSLDPVALLLLQYSLVTSRASQLGREQRKNSYQGKKIPQYNNIFKSWNGSCLRNAEWWWWKIRITRGNLYMLVFPFLFKGMMVMNYMSYQKTMHASNGAGRELISEFSVLSVTSRCFCVSSWDQSICRSFYSFHVISTYPKCVWLFISTLMFHVCGERHQIFQFKLCW